MKKNLIIGLSVTTLALAGAGAAYAATPVETVTRAEAQAHAAEMFAQMDANKDGKLDAADRGAHQAAKFAQLDSNKDGSLSREEFAAGHHDRREPGARREGSEPMGRHHGGDGAGEGGSHGMGMMMLGMADANKDSAVTQAEFTAAHLQHFDMADTNKDGSLSAAERRTMRDKMREHMRGKRGMGGPDAPPPPGA